MSTKCRLVYLMFAMPSVEVYNHTFSSLKVEILRVLPSARTLKHTIETNNRTEQYSTCRSLNCFIIPFEVKDNAVFERRSLHTRLDNGDHNKRRTGKLAIKRGYNREKYETKNYGQGAWMSEIVVIKRSLGIVSSWEKNCKKRHVENKEGMYCKDTSTEQDIF